MGGSPEPSVEAVRAALKSQYHAALAMLRAAIRACPEELWLAQDGHANPFWRIAYHTLHYTHLYLQPTNRGFRPWDRRWRGLHRFDRPLRGRPPCTKAEALAYWRFVDGAVDAAVDALDLASPHSGFSWYRIPKLEHQIVNIRHVQYHEAQLADRLRAATGRGVGWADARRRRPADRPLASHRRRGPARRSEHDRRPASEREGAARRRRSRP